MKTILLVLCALLAFGGVAEAKKKKNWLFRDYNKLGMQLNVGAPDGAGVDAVIRPLKFLRFNVGGTTDIASGGVRAGVTVAPFYYISPSATIEGGYQFPGNFNRVVAMFASDPKNPLLNSVGYGYVNFHGGLEFGHPNWFMFGIRAGYSYIGTQTSGLQTYINQNSKGVDLKVQEVGVGVWTPSAKINFLVWF
jgi:hypothetical protein